VAIHSLSLAISVVVSTLLNLALLPHTADGLTGKAQLSLQLKAPWWMNIGALSSFLFGFAVRFCCFKVTLISATFLYHIFSQADRMYWSPLNILAFLLSLFSMRLHFADWSPFFYTFGGIDSR
jgi:hypothetical protein